MKHRFARAQQASLDVKVDKNPHTTKVFRRFSVDSVHARIRSFSLHTTLFFCCCCFQCSTCKLGKQAFMRATGILWQLKDGGRSNWVLKCLTVEPPLSDHPQREYNYSQTLLCGHPVTSNMDTSLLRDKLLCSWGKKAKFNPLNTVTPR